MLGFLGLKFGVLGSRASLQGPKRVWGFGAARVLGLEVLLFFGWFWGF